MKKVITSIVIAGVALIASMQFTSCEKYVLPEISLSTDTLIFDSQESTQSLTVTSNVIWSIELDSKQQSWITLSRYGSYSSDVTDITVSENLGTERTTVLIVGTEAINKNLTIIQKARSYKSSSSPFNGEKAGDLDKRNVWWRSFASIAQIFED